MSNFSRYVPDYGLALKKSIELIEDVKISDYVELEIKSLVDQIIKLEVVE